MVPGVEVSALEASPRLAEEEPRTAPGRAWLPGLVPPLAVMLTIHILSSFESSELTIQPPVAHFDKWAHLGAYALLLSSFRFWRGRRARPLAWLPGAIAASLVVAGGDEWHQSFVPGRTPDFFDWIADSFGIGIAALFWAAWSRFRPHRTL